MNFIKDFLQKYKSDEITEEDRFKQFMVDTEFMLGLSSEKLSKEIIISSTTISAWKKGTRIPHLEMRAGIINYIKKILMHP